MALFSFYLLFGSQIEHLIMAPAAGDIVFDICEMVTFGFFVIDMTLRIFVEPNYFDIRWCCRGGSEGGHCSLGSFMFWCDLASTGVILYDVSFINKARYQIVDVEIELEDGMQVDGGGLDKFDSFRPNNLEIDLLITIVRCARVARFVSSKIVVNASNRINWYWLFHRLNFVNPFFYWKRRQARLASLGVTGDDSKTFLQSNRQEKRTTWGDVHIGVLAAIRATAQAEEEKAEEARRHSPRFWKYFKRSMSSTAFQENEKSIALKHRAAMKIQRIWRSQNKVEKYSNDGGSAFGDIALSSEAGESALSTSNNRPGAIDSVDELGRRSTFQALFHSRTSGKLDGDDVEANRIPSMVGAKSSRFQSQSGEGKESQVGSDMRGLTGQRVGIGVLLALVFTVVFTYTEPNSTLTSMMIVLHNQTNNSEFQMDALSSARNTSIPELYMFEPANGPVNITFGQPPKLRNREILRMTVTDSNNRKSVGWFDIGEERKLSAWTEIAATLFIIIAWFSGVTAFVGPVMSLVVIPIERMVRLLGMLMLDPLGYQSTPRFNKFVSEEDELISTTRWTKDVLKGMETTFLMSTIHRIGSLMKVGFGSAGVEIIRNNLQTGQSKDLLILNSQGYTVPCIFLFCDIRQFTAATESLQEEVFAFTNRIAAVVHSICHSYGGAANKNVGDAFLLSWSLMDKTVDFGSRRGVGGPLKARSNQADKALLSVIKICISLHYDKFYLEPLSEAARKKLETKLKDRSGPVVRMGFGLHAGKAVQGAIGSQRKIDATYVSEAVERAEFLESSTKQYGVNILMSGNFHKLLHTNTRRRCRRIDKILIQDENDNEDEDSYREELPGELMELFTFDMDVDAIHRPQLKRKTDADTLSDTGSLIGETRRSKGMSRRSITSLRGRRRSTSVQPTASTEFLVGGPGVTMGGPDTNTPGSRSAGPPSVSSVHSIDEVNNPNTQGPPELQLPTGPALYSHNNWQSPDMRRIREKFVQGLFFQKYSSGLNAFYNRDWETAEQCFTLLIRNFDDGPSKYFMEQIIKHNREPPRDFLAYGLA